MNVVKRLLISILFLFVSISCVFADESKCFTFEVDQQSEDSLKYGNIIVKCNAAELLKCFEYGDLLCARFDDGETFFIPLCGDYDDVPAGEMLIRAKKGKNYVAFAINYGQFGIPFGFIEPAPKGSKFAYTKINAKFPKTVTVSLYEKGAYLEKIAVGKLVFSKDRHAYPMLTDEDFCNFREVFCGSIGHGKLFRSSSPIDDDILRNKQADAAVEKYCIKSIINMSESYEVGRHFKDYYSTNYSKKNVLFLDSTMSLGTVKFNKKMAEGLRFVAENDGPFLIHCTYGKDRTGILCAIIEILCGATAEDVKADFLKSYENLYNVVDGIQKPLGDSLKKTIENIIFSNLSFCYGTPVDSNNMYEKTVDYVQSIGLTDFEIEKIVTSLKLN